MPLIYFIRYYPRLKARAYVSHNTHFQVMEVPTGGALMDAAQELNFLPGFNLEGYPNRDSTIYTNVSVSHHTVRATQIEVMCCKSHADRSEGRSLNSYLYRLLVCLQISYLQFLKLCTIGWDYYIQCSTCVLCIVIFCLFVMYFISCLLL